MCTLDELYQAFKEKNPNDTLSFAQFKMLKPWNIKKAYRETCLCRSCESFALYREALQKVAKFLKPLCTLTEQQEDEEANMENEEMLLSGRSFDSKDDDATQPKSSVGPPTAGFNHIIARLQQFCCVAHKSQMADAMVCGGKLECAKPDCVAGTCTDCGFKKCWAPVRAELVDSSGQLQDGASQLWQSSIRYEVLRSSSSPADGSTLSDKEDLRERKEASIIEFLDEFKRISHAFPAHRQLVHAAKTAAIQRDRNFWPGMLLSDYDWSENGVIASARQIQSEYWSLKYYSLFIQITTYLKCEEWLDQCSVLPIDAEVTVELDGDSFGKLEPATGAFYAKVCFSPGEASENGLYWVKVYGHSHMADGSIVYNIPRQRLRHRVKYTTATIGITNEKRHDSVTTQHFLDRQFQHWLLHVDREHFWAWIGHSDNATHFKSGAYCIATIVMPSHSPVTQNVSNRGAYTG